MKAWTALTIHGLGALCALALIAGTAQAGSRFETSAIPGAKVAAHVDFAIVIPEVVYLGSAVTSARKGAAGQLTMQVADPGKPDHRYRALTNGGTLAFAQSGVAPLRPSETGSESGLSEVLPIRVYVVAMP